MGKLGGAVNRAIADCCYQTPPRYPSVGTFGARWRGHGLNCQNSHFDVATRDSVHEALETAAGQGRLRYLAGKVTGGLGL